MPSEPASARLSGVAHPPLAPLRDAVARLEHAGIRCALGASGLLAFLGLATAVHDWDVTADADLPALEALFTDRRSQSFGPSGVHADHKLTLLDLDVEVIARFAFFGPRGVCRIPTRVSARVDGIPLASPEAWAAAYVLLERDAKAELLFGYLEREGAEREACEALLAEPLPDALARRIRNLRIRSSDAP